MDAGTRSFPTNIDSGDQRDGPAAERVDKFALNPNFGRGRRSDLQVNQLQGVAWLLDWQRVVSGRDEIGGRLVLFRSAD